MTAARRCIFLTGAPAADTLDWADGGLLSSFSIPGERHHGSLTQSDTTDNTSFSFPKWRSVPLTTPHAIQPEQTQFLRLDDQTQATSQQEFLDHSHAFLEQIQSSKPAGADDSTVFDTTLGTFDTSFAGTSFNSNDYSIVKSNGEPDLPNVDLNGPITDIKTIPNAAHITRIAPQTVTINLIAGIISIAPARTVTLRRRPVEMDIVEITLGDDTRAGFAVSIWLTPEESQHRPADDLRDTIRELRVGDVVLVRNVALSAFRGCVYGQSLSRRFSRNSTSFYVLNEPHDGLLDPFTRTKAGRVRQWVGDFVGRPADRKSAMATSRGKKRTRDGDEVLPPDTQD